MHKINNFIKEHIITLFTIYLFIQPVLDVITSIALYKFNLSLTIGSIVRILFLAFTIYYLLIIDRKKINIKILICILLYSLIFILCNILFKDNCNITYEIKSLLNNLYLPISLMVIFQILYKKEYNKKYLFIILLIYMLLVFIPNILNIGFNSYAYAKEGSVGLFYSANAVGSIISILSPIFISELIKKRKKLYLILFLIMYSYILLTLGTKAPLLCACIILIYYILYVVVKLIKKKSYKKLSILCISFILFIIASIKLITLTPFYDNLIIHLNFLNIKSLKDLFTYHNIDHFIFSSRLTFFKKSFKIYISSNIFQKLFGIGYYLNGKVIKLVEMDYFDTFIHQGIIGLIIIYFMYFKIIFKTIKSYFSKFKENFLNIEKSSIIISIIISVLCALLTGHVLATPAVSIFVAILLVIYYNYICVKGDKNDEV